MLIRKATRRSTKNRFSFRGSLCSFVDESVLFLFAKRNEIAQPFVTQEDSATDQRAEKDWSQYPKRSLAGVDVRVDRAAKITRQQDGPQNGGPRNHIDDCAGKQDDSERNNNTFGISVILGSLDGE